MSKDFPPEFRLKSKSDFNALRGGCRLRTNGLHFIYRKNELMHARLGLAVSKKYGNAVNRNALKRRLRETFRKHGVRLCPVDILVYPAKGAQLSTSAHTLMNQGLSKINNVFYEKKT